MGERYNRRPQKVEAVQFTGDNLDDLTEFMGGPKVARVRKAKLPGPGRGMHDGARIQLLDGQIAVSVGGWIARAVGEDHVFVMSDDMFRSTYVIPLSHRVRANG